MGQAVIFTKFEAVAMHLGRSSRTAAGLKNYHLLEVMVTCLDPHNDGCIGGEDLDESLALLDTTSGKIKLVASGRYKGWPMAASNEGLMLRTMQGVDVAVQLKAAGDEPECWSNDPAEVIAHVRNHGSSWMIQLTGDVLAKLRGQAVVEESRQASLAFAA